MEAGGQQPMSSDSSTEVPSSPPIATRLPSSLSSFERYCAPSQAPTMDPLRLNHRSYDPLRDLGEHHVYHRKNAKEVSKNQTPSI